MRLAQLIKLVGALEIGEVWYIRVGEHTTSAVICTPPGSTLRDSFANMEFRGEKDQELTTP